MEKPKMESYSPTMLLQLLQYLSASDIETLYKDLIMQGHKPLLSIRKSSCEISFASLEESLTQTDERQDSKLEFSSSDGIKEEKIEDSYHQSITYFDRPKECDDIPYDQCKTEHIPTPTPVLAPKVLKSSKKITKLNKNGTPRAISKKGLWTEEEDGQIRSLIEMYGPKWTFIGSIMGNKNGKQVRDRYLNISRPGVSSNNWSEKEDKLFISLLERHGKKWSKIAEEMPGRTENQVKNRFYSVIRTRKMRNKRRIELKEAIKAVTEEKPTMEN